MLMPWLAIYLLELALYLSPLWTLRKWLTDILIVLVGSSSLAIGWQLVLPLQIALGFLTVFRLLNLLRVRKARMHDRYLLRTTARSSLYILVFHVLAVWFYYILQLFTVNQLLDALIFMQLVTSLGILAITSKNAVKLRFKMPKSFLPDSQLPTVTVAIPARNETIDLHECMDSLLSNDYSKLEIIVLDETPHSKTAEIIREYANDGVRFVLGEEPGARWLAKNQAYHKLYTEASGDLILFCGVDTRFGKRAISSMVNLLHARNKSMLSVLPLRDRSTAAAAFIQPMRYWWELALPRRIFNRPPVLSTCWMIDRGVLKKLGGFAAVSHTIIPEGVFARELIKDDKYSFVRSSNELDVRTVKNLTEQRETSIRLRYPQIRRRLEVVPILTAYELLFLLLPFVLLLIANWLQLGFWIWPVLVSCLGLITTHIIILSVSNPANVPLGLFNFPIVVIVELAIAWLSMIRYEFFSVEWKQRNIVEPVMHVIPSLPPID